MSFNFEVFGKRVREARLKMGLTQEKLAELIEVSTVYISHIEIGNSIPSLDTFIRLCNTLNVTPNFLLSTEYNETPEYLIEDILSFLKDCSLNDLKLYAAILRDIIKYKQ